MLFRAGALPTLNASREASAGPDGLRRPVVGVVAARPGSAPAPAPILFGPASPAVRIRAPSARDAPVARAGRVAWRASRARRPRYTLLRTWTMSPSLTT